jgi:phytoene dehydrogenase-like protein
MRLAIVGAGIRGCSAAYFAHRLVPSLDVTIYERSDRVGGRIYGVEIDDEWVEVGASFFKGGHRLLIGLIAELGIMISPVPSLRSIGVWDGERFIFRSDDPVIAAIRLLTRHPGDILRLYLMLRELSSRNRALYSEVESHSGEWGELYSTAGINEWLEKTVEETLLKQGIHPRFIHDVVEPVIRVIYNQGSSINTYAGLLTMDILNGRTYKVVSGNEVIPRRLVEVSGTTVRLGTEVKGITKGNDGKYTVSGEGFSDEYDAVIIANPDACNLIPGCLPVKYQRVYIRIVSGTLRSSYFLLRSGQSLPETIVSTREVPWTHIIKLPSAEDKPLYSIASPAPVDYLEDIFAGYDVVFEHDWEKAYPVLEPVRELPRCEVGRLLYNPSYSESAVSAMESSVLSALNCVNKLKRDLDR